MQTGDDRACRLLRTAASAYRMHIVEERRAAGRFRYRPVAQGIGGAALPNSRDRDRRQLYAFMEGVRMVSDGFSPKRRR